MRMRFLGIIVVIALLASSAGVRPADAAGTVPFVSVSTMDGYVGEYEEYHISFLLNRDVKLGEAISIIFDDSVNRAGSREIAAEDVSIDGTPAGASTRWSGHTLTVPFRQPFWRINPIACHPAVAMIQNPAYCPARRGCAEDDGAGTTRDRLLRYQYGQPYLSCFADSRDSALRPYHSAGTLPHGTHGGTGGYAGSAVCFPICY